MHVVRGQPTKGDARLDGTSSIVLGYDLEAICSFERDFDPVSGVSRIEP